VTIRCAVQNGCRGVRMWMRAGAPSGEKNASPPGNRRGATGEIRSRPPQLSPARTNLQGRTLHGRGSRLRDSLLGVATAHQSGRLRKRVEQRSPANGKSAHPRLRASTWANTSGHGIGSSLPRSIVRQPRPSRSCYSCGEHAAEPPRSTRLYSARQDALPSRASLFGRQSDRRNDSQRETAKLPRLPQGGRPKAQHSPSKDTLIRGLPGCSR
jgi:hypothetical protein